MKHILVTGSSGYIGKSFINAFKKSKYDLYLFGKSQVKNNFKFLQGDVKCYDDTLKATKGVDIILHLAAVTSDIRDLDDTECFETNTIGTLNILKAAVENKVKKVIYASSVCAVGFRGSHKLIKETDRCKPSDEMYGYSKYLSERLCELYSNKYNLNIICLRFAMIVPQHNLSIPNRFFIPYWLGVIHIDDVVQAIQLSIENASIKYGVYHIAANSFYSKFDIKKAKKELKFAPEHNFEDLINPSFFSKTITFLMKTLFFIRGKIKQ